jgi:hypothetical protein
VSRWSSFLFEHPVAFFGFVALWAVLSVLLVGLIAWAFMRPPADWSRDRRCLRALRDVWRAR